RWTGETWIADSTLFNNGIKVGIGTQSPTEQLHTTGGVRHESLSGDGFRLVYADDNGKLITPGVSTNNNSATNSTHYSIPDGDCNGITSSITISGQPSSVASSTISVTLNIAHTYDDDILVYLIAPDGSVLNLIFNVGNDGDNFTNTVLFDGAPANLSSSSAPFAGTYKPSGSIDQHCDNIIPTITTFSALGGGNINPNGQWQLKVIDYFTEDVGTLNSWSINIGNIQFGTNNYVPKWNNGNLTNTSNIYDDGYHVGIGTDTPAYSLTLGDGGKLGVANATSFLSKNTNGHYEVFMHPRWSDDVMYINYGAHGFNIRDNNSASTMFMSNTNNVGIGTIYPSAKLEVNGTIKITDGTQGTNKILVSDSSGLASWQLPGSINGLQGPQGAPGQTGPQGLQGEQGPAGADGSSNGWALTGNTGTTGENFIGTKDANDLVIKTSDAEQMRISTAGNVGIGTSTPSTKLEIRGTTKTTNFQMPTGATKNYVLTSDSLGNARWAKSELDAIASSTPKDFSCASSIGSITTASTPICVTTSGNYAYVTDYAGNDLRVYDISNPAAPVWINTAGTATGVNPTQIAISGNYAYVTDAGDNDLRVYDISNPSAPVWVNTGGTSTGTNPIFFTISGNYAYVLGTNSNDLRIYDVSNPTSPVWMNTAGTSTGSAPIAIAVSGNYAYVVDLYDDDFRIYDISNPAAPALKSTTGTGDFPMYIAVSGNYAYVVDNHSNDLRVYDISNPEMPVWVNTAGTSTGDGPYSVVVKDNYAFVIDAISNDLRVYDISNPTSPVWKNTGGTSTDYYPRSLAISGNNAYVVNENSDNLQVFQLGCSTTESIIVNPATGAFSTTPILWQEANSNISNTNAGNVGIGTHTPQNKLDINGSTALGAYAGTNAAPLEGLIVSGNVGIGTAFPSHKLTLGEGGNFGVANSSTFFSKNANGVYENFLIPRSSNNAMYLNYGSSGFNIRNNGSVSTLFMSDNNNVGIGTLNPTAKLDVNGGIKSSGTYPYGFYSDINTVDNEGYGGWFRNTTSYKDVFGVYGEANYTGYNNPAYNYGGKFVSNSTTQDGYGVYGLANKTNPNFTTFTVGVYGAGVNAGTVGDCYGVKGYAYGGANSYGVYGTADNGHYINYGVYCNGNGAYTGTWTLASDLKFKKDITDLKDDALTNLLKLRPVSYMMKLDEYPEMNFAKGLQMGFVAQDMQKIFPTLVENGVHPGTKKDDKNIEYLGINYTGLIPILVKSLQQQQTIIENLKSGYDNKIKLMQKQIDELKSQIKSNK
ncbi:MAG: beta-propeller fold lactonase family protein, partial [Bacteroidota bacterium]